MSEWLQNCARIFKNAPSRSLEYRGIKEFAAGQQPASQEALRLECKLGWISLGKRGGVVGGTLFVLPSLFVLLALSVIYFKFGNLPWIAEMFDSEAG